MSHTRKRICWLNNCKSLNIVSRWMRSFEVTYRWNKRLSFKIEFSNSCQSLHLFLKIIYSLANQIKGFKSAKGQIKANQPIFSQSSCFKSRLLWPFEYFFTSWYWSFWFSTIIFDLSIWRFLISDWDAFRCSDKTSSFFSCGNKSSNFDFAIG